MIAGLLAMLAIAAVAFAATFVVAFLLAPFVWARHAVRGMEERAAARQAAAAELQQRRAMQAALKAAIRKRLAAGG